MLGTGSGESDVYFAGSLVSNRTTEPSCYKRNSEFREKEESRELITHPAKT